MTSRDAPEQMFEPARPTRIGEGLAMLVVEAATRWGFVVSVTEVEAILDWSHVTAWRTLRLLHRRRMVRRVRRGTGGLAAAYRLAPRGVRWLARLREGRARPTWRDDVLSQVSALGSRTRREITTTRARAA